MAGDSKGVKIAPIHWSAGFAEKPGHGRPAWRQDRLDNSRSDTYLFQHAGPLYLLAQCKTPRNPVDGCLGLFAKQTPGWRQVWVATN